MKNYVTRQLPKKQNRTGKDQTIKSFNIHLLDTCEQESRGMQESISQTWSRRTPKYPTDREYVEIKGRDGGPTKPKLGSCAILIQVSARGTVRKSLSL